MPERSIDLDVRGQVQRSIDLDVRGQVPTILAGCVVRSFFFSLQLYLFSIFPSPGGGPI